MSQNEMKDKIESIAFVLPPVILGGTATDCNVLSMVNGRPVLTWILQDLLKHTNDKIFVIDVDNPERISKYIDSHYPPHSRVRFCQVSNLFEIPKLIAKIRSDYKETILIRLVRNDVLIVNVPYTEEVQIVLSDNGEIGRVQSRDVKTIFPLIQVERNNQAEALPDNQQNGCFKQVKVSAQHWIDFSHQEGLENAKTKLIESRSFNSLRIHPLYPEITKRSSNVEKLQNEVFWYRELPSRFKSLTPQVFGHDANGIRMEYYGYGTLTEKFLYGELSLEKWESIIQRLFNIVKAFSEVKFNANHGIFSIFYCSKLEKRLAALEKFDDLQQLISADQLFINDKCCKGLPELLPYIKNAMERIATSAQGTVCHGDMCFNNILYDLPTGIVKLIDPRGNIEGIPSIICDPRYDIAKIRHSFCGNYDGIVEGDFCVIKINEGRYLFETARDKTLSKRETLFDGICSRNGFINSEIQIIEAYLFLTMIPLHADSIEKMKAFFLLSIIKFNQIFK